MALQTKAEEVHDKISDRISELVKENQDTKTVAEVCARVKEILTTGEQILYVAIQKKLVINITPDCVVLTNRRFIGYRPKLFGRVSFEDHIWRDLSDAQLKEGILGSTLTLKTVRGVRIVLDHLPKAQARRVYAFAQEMEERVKEERRRRELEDKRATAGGIVMNTDHGSNQGVTESTKAQDDPVETLKKLKQMLDSGLITPGEYESKRAEIISKM